MRPEVKQRHSQPVCPAFHGSQPPLPGLQHFSWPWRSQGVYAACCHAHSALPACAVSLTLPLPCSFVTFEEESSVDDCFNYGSHHELAGKKVEVKSATPRGSGPVGPSTGRGPIGQRGLLPERPGFGPRQGQAYPFPGQMGSPNYGMQFPAMARWASMAVCVGAVPSNVRLADVLGMLHASCGHPALLGLPAGQVVVARSDSRRLNPVGGRTTLEGLVHVLPAPQGRSQLRAAAGLQERLAGGITKWPDIFWMSHAANNSLSCGTQDNDDDVMVRVAARLQVHSYNPSKCQALVISVCSSGQCQSPSACQGLFDAALRHELESHVCVAMFDCSHSSHLPAMSRALHPQVSDSSSLPVQGHATELTGTGACNPE